MFGLSFGKLLLLALAIAGVWYLARMANRNTSGPLVRRSEPKGAPIDLVQNPTTGAYEAKSDAHGHGAEGR